MTRKVRDSSQLDSSRGEAANSSDNSSANLRIPRQVLAQADAVASAAAAASSDTPQDHNSISYPPLEDVPPPPYSASQYGEVDISTNGFQSGARVANDGRVDIKIDEINRRLTRILTRQLPQQAPSPQPEPEIPEGLGSRDGLPCPPLNIVIQVVGSRGDVQPFVALGQVLKNKYNHRVRLATHPVFRDFVTENGLEFFNIGGDPAELMAFMVKNPGLIPGVEALRSGDIGKRRKGIYEMINGCWRSCIEPGDGSGPPVSDVVLDRDNNFLDSSIDHSDPAERPFVADAIIANPPSFAHIHIAEKLGIPLHLMFTMPWSPTQAYPHPLANILSSNTDQGMANFISYILVDLLTWQGIGDVINRFREKALRLEPISVIWAPGSLHRLRIPWTYAWSPALIPKPSDWQNFIDVSGFFFLDLATNYSPPADLAAFLAAGPPPVYIGFGSIVVDDPNALTSLIFEAVKMTGHRALVSKGWGGFSAGELGQPDDVFMLGNCPHDWLFQRVSAVVHHGGAGTTAAGVKAGKPTVIIPFFGDQPFWGSMVHRAGAGPQPIPHKELTARSLADAILQALHPDCLTKAQELSTKIQNENGPENGAQSFHKFLQVPNMRCSVAPGRAAVWRIKRTNIRLSALAATVLANANLIDFADLKLYRPREYEVDTGPPEPIMGGAAAIIGNLGSITAGVADFPSEVLKSFRSAVKEGNTKKKRRCSDDASSSIRSPASTSTDDVVARHADHAAVASTMTDSISTDVPSVWDLDDTPRGRPSTTTPPSTVGDPIEKLELKETTEGGAVQNRTHRDSLSHRLSLSNRHIRCQSEDAGRITLGTAIGSAKATGNIIAIGLKSPLDFTMSLAKGFHNLPRLYNDSTVRPAEKVTDFQSGLKAAGKTFAYGFMDGIGGLVTQPMQGFREEGSAGLVKGLVKGSFGLIVKPGAAIWGLPAYTMKGLYEEIVKNIGRSTTNYILAARMAQGYEDYRQSSEGERERIVAAWHSPEFETRYAQRQSSRQVTVPGTSGTSAPLATNEDRLVDKNGRLLSGFLSTRHLSFDERKELARRKEEQRQLQGSPSTTTDHSPDPDLARASEAEFRDAIREAVQRTSTNDTREDQAIENAIWASVRELQRSTTQEKTTETRGAKNDIELGENDDEAAYQRVVAASVAEYKRSQKLYAGIQDGQESGVALASDGPAADYDEDVELTRAITASLEEYSRGISSASEMTTSNGIPGRSDAENIVYNDDDADLQRALEASSQLFRESSQARSNLSSLQPAHARLTAHNQPEIYELPASDQPDRISTQDTTRRTDDGNSNNDDNDDNDADLKEAIRQSKLENQKQRSDLDRQKTEEDIVLEYVKRQSLAEEEYRRRHHQ